MEESSNQHSNSMAEVARSWLSNHWLVMLMIFVGGIIVLAILKVINQLFNGNGPVSKGVADVLGTLANFANGLINGCTAQSDCVATTSADCTSKTGCGWYTPPTAGKDGSCVNTTGKAPSSGSFFAPSCILGIGSLIWLSGLVIVFIIKPIVARLNRKNANVDVASQTSGESVEDIVNEVAKKSIKDADVAQKTLEAEKGRDLNSVEMTQLGKQTANININIRALESINGQSGVTPAERALQSQNVQDNYAKDSQQYEDEAKHEGMSNDDIKTSEDAAEEATGHSIDILNIISNNALYNIHTPLITLKYYIEIIKRKNLQLSNNHIEYLNKYTSYYKNIM